MEEISGLRYFHGMGIDSGSKRPVKTSVAVSVGASEVTDRIVESMETEGILSLKTRYGDPTAGEPVEVDRLEIDFEAGRPSHEVTVFNRGLMLLFADDVDVRRLHRFFGVVEQEIGRTA